MRHAPVAQCPFKGCIGRIVDIQVDKIHLILVLFFQRVHQGRHGLRGAIPKGKEHHKLHIPGSQFHLIRIGSL